MATQTRSLSLPSSAYRSEKVDCNFASIPYSTTTTSAEKFHAINDQIYCANASSRSRDDERSEFDYTSSQPSDNESVTSPIAVRIRPRRLSGHLFGPHTISPDESNRFDGSLQGEVATAVRISQHRPQAINVTSSRIDIESANFARSRTKRAVSANAAKSEHPNPLRCHAITTHSRPNSSSSWISQSTFSDDSSFQTLESATSASTISSTHEVVKGFAPGGPPSMYRSQSNLSNLSRLVLDCQRTSSPARAPSRDSHVTTSDEGLEDEYSIDDGYEDGDSVSDSDYRSIRSGLTMLFASKLPTKPSKVCPRLYTLSPRKTRSQMLASELTKPIQESLLQDRQHKRQVNLASIRRTQSDILYSDCYFNAGIFQYW